MERMRRSQSQRWWKAFFCPKIAAALLFPGAYQSFAANPEPLEAPAVLWTSSLSQESLPAHLVLFQPTPANVDIQVSAPPAATAKQFLRAPPEQPAQTLGGSRPVSANIIDLATAFQLAGAQSPVINYSREVVREAAAAQLGAQSLLLPSIVVGGNYHYHTGTLQASSGIIRRVDEQSLFFGLGAHTLAAESVAYPGIRIFSHLGDALFAPLAARQFTASRQALSLATENNTLLEVAEAYFELLRAEVVQETLRNNEARANEIVRLTTAYARAQQGRISDEHRAATRANLIHKRLQEADGGVAAASARLGGLLNLDPSVRLKTPGGAVQPIRLIDENEDLASLVQRAISNRPEVRVRLQEIAAARTRVRQEKTRPLFPTLSIGFSAGGFGGGSNLTAAGIRENSGAVVSTSSFGNFSTRTDADVFAVWTLQNLGVGNRALARRAEAVLGEAFAELEQTNNEVREQVASARAEALAAARQIEVVRPQLADAEEGFRQEMLRIKETIGRPIETLDSFRLLLDSQLEMVRAIVAYNAAQYRLFVAIGLSPLQSPETAAGQPGYETAP